MIAPAMAGALLTIAALLLALIGAVVMALAARDEAKRVHFQATVDVERMTGEVTYWRTRAEQMADAALIRSGAVPGPVMHTPPAKPKDPMSQMLSGMAVQEIDSRSKGAA